MKQQLQISQDELRFSQDEHTYAKEVLTSLMSLPEEEAFDLVKRIRSAPDRKPGTFGTIQQQSESLPAEILERLPELPHSTDESQGNFNETSALNGLPSPSSMSPKSEGSSQALELAVSRRSASATSSEMEVILNALASRSDFECSAILARLRIGDRWYEVANDVVTGRQISVQASRYVSRLPHAGSR